MTVRLAKIQISLGIRQSNQSSQCAQWVAKEPSFLHTDSEDSDQTGRTAILLVLSGGGSNNTVLMLMMYNAQIFVLQ